MNYAEIVQELNEELFRFNNSSEFQFSYETDGLTHIIKFAEMWVWRSDDDKRDYSSVLNAFEPLKPYLIQSAKALILELNEVKFE